MKRILFLLLSIASLAPAFGQTGVQLNPEEIRRRYIEAVGGATAINGIKDIKLVYAGEVQGTKLTYTEWKSEGRIRKEVTVMGTIYQEIVYANGKARTEIQGKPKEMSASEIALLKRDADIQAVLYPEKYGITRTFMRQEKGDTVLFNVVEASDKNGHKTVEFYDDKTGLLLREGTTQDSPQGPMTVLIAYSDFREVPGTGGYKIPYNLRQGSVNQELEFNLIEVEINKGMKEGLFQ